MLTRLLLCYSANRRTFLLLSLACQDISGDQTRSSHSRIIYRSSRAPAPIGPYNQAVRLDDVLYISGQIGLHPETGEMMESVEDQTFQTLNNMAAILELAGATFNNVIKATVFLADINDFSAVNEIYQTYFTEDFPARAAIQIAALPKGAKVEIEAVAVVGDLVTQYEEN